MIRLVSDCTVYLFGALIYCILAAAPRALIKFVLVLAQPILSEFLVIHYPLIIQLPRLYIL